MKPYLIYNEYGCRMIAHPDLPYCVGVPAKGLVQRAMVGEIISALIIGTLQGEEREKLIRGISELTSYIWEMESLPEMKTIRS